MNLEDLKLFFEAEHRRQEDLDEYVLRTKESSLVDELNALKIQKHNLSKEKEQNESQLGDLMATFNKKKEIEKKADYEKNEIQKALRVIEKNKVSALEFEK